MVSFSNKKLNEPIHASFPSASDPAITPPMMSRRGKTISTSVTSLQEFHSCRYREVLLLKNKIEFNGEVLRFFGLRLIEPFSVSGCHYGHEVFSLPECAVDFSAII